MATASKLFAGGNASYVFKMQYDAGGSAPMHRRYGYAGELALPQVYEVSTHSAIERLATRTDSALRTTRAYTSARVKLLASRARTS